MPTCPTFSTLRENDKNLTGRLIGFTPVVLLHKRIGGDRGEADADEEVDEEVGDEAKVEDGRQ